jgi:hypothetical protein
MLGLGLLLLEMGQTVEKVLTGFILLQRGHLHRGTFDRPLVEYFHGVSVDDSTVGWTADRQNTAVDAEDCNSVASTYTFDR